MSEHDDERPNLIVLPRTNEIEGRSVLEEVAAERTVTDIEESEKVEFLQLVRQGLNRQEAANALGYKGRHFRSLCSPQSPFYDEDFAARYGEVIGSLEHQEGYLERLRSEATRRALIDSDRLLEKLLMVHDPDWTVLRQKDIQINQEVLVKHVFKNLPTEKLEQLIGWLDEEEVVEGEITELPSGNGNDPE